MNVTLFSLNHKKEAPAKIHLLCKKLSAKKVYLQIICPNPETVTYIDKLLWSLDPIAFLPHTTELPSQAPIYITMNPQLTAPFTHALWLLPKNPPADLGALHLYDFDDKSSNTTAAQAQERYHFYKEQGYAIALIS